MQYFCDLCGNSFKGKGYLLRHFERRHLKFSCIVCNSIYKQKRNLLDHLRSHFEKFICNYCGIKIYKREKFDQHVLSVHEPSKRKFPYSCRFCERKFPSAIFRNCHERNVHRGRKESAFKCKNCDQVFLKRDQLRLHMLENHYSGSIFFCPFKECDRYFKTSKLLRTHEKIHSPAGYQCKSCQKSFQQSSNFSKHKKRCKGPLVKKNYTDEELEKFSEIAKEQFILYGGKLKPKMELKDEDLGGIKIVNNKCKNLSRKVKKIIPKLTDEFIKNKNKNPQNSLKIKKNKSTNNENKLTKKIKQQNLIEGVKTFETICDICGVKIKSPTDFKKHMNIHLKVTQFSCPEMNCSLTFKLKGNLMKHMKQVHLKERPFQCDICGMSLKTKHHLLNHLKIHGKPQTCPICSITLPNIEAHIRRHQQVKGTIFACLQCGRECATKQALEEHIQRIHEKKPLGKFYTCSVCEENFIRNSDLRRHSFVHYQGKIFSCTYPGCVEMFKTSYKLHLHQTVHLDSNQKTFTCDICSKSYRRQTALYKHKKSHAVV